MSALSSLYGRLAAALSGLRNAFFGQTRSRARLNVIASYDQSNELFKVRPLAPSMHSFASARGLWRAYPDVFLVLGLSQQGDDVLLRALE